MPESSRPIDGVAGVGVPFSSTAVRSVGATDSIAEGTLKRVSSPERAFPVVCVGGSAGGLDAYIRLLRHLPADLGVAIVIVNHVRTLATQLHEILPRFTGMPVELITVSNRTACSSSRNSVTCTSSMGSSV